MNSSDKIIKALVILFLIKPTFDLLWFLPRFNLGGVWISVLHVAAAFVFIYFGRFIFQYPGVSAPGAKLFKIFILANLATIAISSLTEPISPIEIINFGMRVVISYIIFNVAYFAAFYGTDRGEVSLVRAISVGTFIVMLLNFSAIVLGYGGEKMGSNQSLRAIGLYHDSGTLGNVALYNIIFTAFFLHILPRRHVLWLLYAGTSIVLALYLIYIGLSRVVFVQFFVFGAIYLFMFKQGLSRLVPIGFMALVILGASLSGFDMTSYSQRFESEIEVFDTDVDIETKQDKDVDLGRFERLGSNRGQLIAYALDDYIKRDFVEQLIGKYTLKSSHSDYFDVLMRNGAVGLAIYLAMLFMIARNALLATRKMRRPSPSPLQVLAFSLIVLYILYSLPFRPLLLTTTAWMMWATIGFAFGVADSADRPNDEGKRHKENEEKTGSARILRPARRALADRSLM